MEQHNNIINDVAKKILAPEGLFRKGSSRCWIDDNDWFFIVVEFQPSAFEKGSYLNVGIDFLWEKTAALNDGLSFDYGGRVLANGNQFASYQSDHANSDKDFASKIEAFAATALDEVTEYRKFRDLEYAKTALKKKVVQTSEKHLFWEVYHLAMLCFFKRDYEEGKRYFDRYMDILKGSFYYGNLYMKWKEEFYNHCRTEICPQITSTESAQRMVFDMINRRRKYFSSKSSFKKMNKDILF